MAHVSANNTSAAATGIQSVIDRIAGLRTSLSTRLAQHRTYRKTYNELCSLSSRELNDLGLNAGTIRSVALEAAYK